MKNISKYCAKTEIKPELNKVYVHLRDGKRYAVATDSFRMAVLDITEHEMIKEGYYTQKEWTKISSLLGKKKDDIYELTAILKGAEAMQDSYKEYIYPDYTELLKRQDNLDSAPLGNLKFNPQYLTKFLEFMEKDEYGAIDLNNIKQKKESLQYPILYFGEKITLLLMPMAE